MLKHISNYEKHLIFAYIVINLNTELKRFVDMVKHANNSTATIKGFIYQFLVALGKCFELKASETLYIETYGDISIMGCNDAVQIESKFYKDYLTDYDHNIWNTLNNWINDDFPIDSFSSLVLLTTQNVKTTSIWFDWNDKNLSEKIKIVQNAANKYYRKKSNKDAKTEKLIQSVLNESKNERLKKVLKKFVIDNNALNDIKYYNHIKETYAKTIPEIRQDEFIRCMLGYVISPQTIEKNWCITYDKFRHEANVLAQSLIDTTTHFPSKIRLMDIKHEEYSQNPFVDKIKQIKYDEVVLDAITDYVQTKELIINEIITSKKIYDSLNEYEEDLLHRHNILYRKACRNCPNDSSKIRYSKDFYDNMMFANDHTFYIYNSIPSYFHNGMLHILADEKEEFVWLLKL